MGPYLPVTAYKYLTTETKQLTFKHNFDDERKQKYRRLKTSPYANDEVNRLVNACLNSTSIGKDNVPDLLSLAYYAGIMITNLRLNYLWRCRIPMSV